VQVPSTIICQNSADLTASGTAIAPFSNVGAIAKFVDYAVSQGFKCPIRVLTKVWTSRFNIPILFPGVEFASTYHTHLGEILPDDPPEGNYPPQAVVDDSHSNHLPSDVNPVEMYVPDPFNLLDMDETEWSARDAETARASRNDAERDPVMIWEDVE